METTEKKTKEERNSLYRGKKSKKVDFFFFGYWKILNKFWMDNNNSQNLFGIKSPSKTIVYLKKKLAQITVMIKLFIIIFDILPRIVYNFFQKIMYFFEVQKEFVLT